MWHKFSLSRKLILAALFIVAVGVVIAFTVVTHPSKSLSGDEQVKQTIAKISKHYILPTDETPALATVTNSNKLTSQFLKKAENGDEVLIYKDNELAIIYRPSVDRIVSVGPVKLDATAPYSGR